MRSGVRSAPPMTSNGRWQPLCLARRWRWRRPTARGHGDDRLEGGAGNDRLAGQWGNDVLIGGAGADEFVIGRNADEIRDFEPGADHVQVGFGFQSGAEVLAFIADGPTGAVLDLTTATPRHLSA